LRDVALLADKSLAADTQSIRVAGESRIPSAPGSIRRLQLEPSDPPAHPEAIRAILAADLIALGPGSLYTSVLPNLLVPDLTSAIRNSRALRVFVCNVATQTGETDGYDCLRHLAALEDHSGPGLVDVILVNDRTEGVLPAGVEWVCADESAAGMVPVHRCDLADPAQPWRHDAAKLAQALITLLEEKTGPLEPPSNGRGERLTALN
jgi:uncharacterized cofD-like protein